MAVRKHNIHDEVTLVTGVQGVVTGIDEDFTSYYYVFIPKDGKTYRIFGNDMKGA